MAEERCCAPIAVKGAVAAFLAASGALVAYVVPMPKVTVSITWTSGVSGSDGPPPSTLALEHPLPLQAQRSSAAPVPPLHAEEPAVTAASGAALASPPAQRSSVAPAPLAQVEVPAVTAASSTALAPAPEFATSAQMRTAAVSTTAAPTPAPLLLADPRPASSTTSALPPATSASATAASTTREAPSDLPGLLRPREKRGVQLNGDPKSGTTLTETIAFLAARTLCNVDHNATQGPPICKIQGEFKQSSRKEFDFTVPDKRASVHFAINNKHTILGTHGPLECQRGEPPLDPPSTPCGYKEFSLSSLQACYKHCVNPKYHAGDLEVKNGVVLLVWRDVRNQMVSICFSEGSGNFVPAKLEQYRKNLPACLKKLFPRIALWSRYRQLWFQQMKPNFHREFVHVCYEALIRSPMTEYRKVLAALGLLASDDQMLRIMDLARPARLKKSSNPDMAKKVRDAGSRTYRDYNISESTLAWMDSIYANLSFDLDHPCIAAQR